MRVIKKLFVGLLLISLLLANVDMIFNTSFITNTVEAHSGRTDSSGGHKDNKNKSGLGSYHYHCGGNPPHLHENGECPYSTSSKTKSTITDKTSNKSSSTAEASAEKSDELKITKSIIKKVQKALNKFGYDCGKVDGSMGKKTKKALKSYQEDNGLEVDGIIGKEVLKALDINYD